MSILLNKKCILMYYIYLFKYFILFYFIIAKSISRIVGTL